MSPLTVVLAVALALLLLGGLKGTGSVRNLAWFLLVVVGAFLFVRLVS